MYVRRWWRRATDLSDDDVPFRAVRDRGCRVSGGVGEDRVATTTVSGVFRVINFTLERTRINHRRAFEKRFWFGEHCCGTIYELSAMFVLDGFVFKEAFKESRIKIVLKKEKNDRVK